jgi:triphosphoribosyl-dephospho-CoA synthase
VTPSDIGTLAALASALEASAPKPGNVSPGRPFRDMGYEDFLASAVAAGPELGRAGERALGETILAAVRATRRWTTANTNLGVVLLMAPLAKAAGAADRPGAGEVGLRGRLRAVLDATSVADARHAYHAIREARPGGLGAAPEQDLQDEPTVTLREAMRLAAARDSVAAEYLSNFAITFDTGLPALRAARAGALGWSEAIVETFLTILAAHPDSLIGRKLGPDAAAAISARAAELLRTGGVRTPAGRAAIAAFDSALRDAHNSRNPGTTADLTAATLFVLLLEDGWRHDRPRIPRAQ